VEDWAGNRIGGTRQLQPITILCVRDQIGRKYPREKREMSYD
jgi:hypothetical protein